MKLNLISPFNTLSYGYVGSYLFHELFQKGLDIKADCYPDSRGFSAESKFSYIKSVTDRFETEFHHNAPCLKIWHQFDLRNFTGQPTIGFPIFELDTFDEREKHNLKYPTYLFTCSQWGKEVILDQVDRDPDTVHVIPLGVDTDVFQPFEYKGETTRFCNFGKWEVRKGHDILIEAFNRAFTVDDDVELIMSCENVFLTPQQNAEWINYYVNTTLGNKVKFVNRQDTHEQVYNIIRDMDVGVFPARAEGWNLELLEFMAAGKHVITTDCTGHTEFCNSKNSMLIDVDKKQTAFDGKFFKGQGNWFSLEEEQINQLVEHMRSVHKKKKGGELGINHNGVKTAQEFTWKIMADKVIQFLEDIS
jgi:glycosyltransferase involved in cell wall biosynthesis